jgi:hypothetical protein
LRRAQQFIGRAIVALATAPNLMNKTGHVLIAVELAQDCDFTYIDGKQPRPLSGVDL